MVFKKDLTPLSRRGSVVKHAGKGATEQRTGGGRNTVTGPDTLGRMMNAYPKAPAPLASPTSAPPLGGPALGAAPPSRPPGLEPV